MIGCVKPRCALGMCCVDCLVRKHKGCQDQCDIAENLLQDRDIISEMCPSAHTELVVPGMPVNLTDCCSIEYEQLGS